MAIYRGETNQWLYTEVRRSSGYLQNETIHRKDSTAVSTGKTNHRRLFGVIDNQLDRLQLVGSGFTDDEGVVIDQQLFIDLRNPPEVVDDITGKRLKIIGLLTELQLGILHLQLFQLHTPADHVDIL